MLLQKINWFEVKYEIYRRYQRSFVNRSYLWFAYRFIPKHRYNLLRTGIKPCYMDVNVRVESALAQVLIDFVEREAYPDTTTTKEAVDAIHKEMDCVVQEDRNSCFDNIAYTQRLIELRDLYLWCKKWQPVISYTGKDPFYDEKTNKYDIDGRRAFEKEVDDMMIRLVNIRNFLWT